MPCRTIAVANQKGGTGKTATTLSLGVALARLGKRVLLVDADPQGDLTKSLGWGDPDALEVTLANHLIAVIEGEGIESREGILSHKGGHRPHARQHRARRDGDAHPHGDVARAADERVARAPQGRLRLHPHRLRADARDNPRERLRGGGRLFSCRCRPSIFLHPP